jgi:hypothetical protein
MGRLRRGVSLKELRIPDFLDYCRHDYDQSDNNFGSVGNIISEVKKAPPVRQGFLVNREQRTENSEQ